MVTIEKDGESKEVKRQDVSAYNKLGWKMVLPEVFETPTSC
jgi:hypothetical protein